MNLHDNIDNFLAADLHGELSQEEHDAFRAHLLECASCRQAHQETKVINTILEDTLAKEKPDAGFERRMIEGFRNRIPQRNGKIATFIADLARLRWAQVGAVTAVLLAVVLAGRMVTTGSLGRHSVPLAKAPTEQASPAAAASSYADRASSDRVEQASKNGATTSQSREHLAITSGSWMWDPNHRSTLDRPPVMATPQPAASSYASGGSASSAGAMRSHKNGAPLAMQQRLSDQMKQERDNPLNRGAYDKAVREQTASPQMATSQPAAAAQPSSIQVLQATYGAGTQQMDVTRKVQSLVQSSQPNVRVGNHLFGKDPIPGQTKTLSVVFTSNGAQYRTDIRESEQLSFSDAHPLNATATPAAPTELPPPPSHHLAPEGTLYVIEYFGINSDSGVIGVPGGARVKLLKDLGETMRVRMTDEHGAEFEIPTDKLTNDLDLAALAAKKDAESVGSLADYMKKQRDIYLAEQEKLNPLYAQQAEDAEKRRAAASTLGTGSKLDGGAYDWHWSVPPWYHGRPFIYRVYTGKR